MKRHRSVSAMTEHKVRDLNPLWDYPESSFGCNILRELIYDWICGLYRHVKDEKISRGFCVFVKYKVIG